jgi:hypothetical protein
VARRLANWIPGDTAEARAQRRAARALLRQLRELIDDD